MKKTSICLPGGQAEHTQWGMVFLNFWPPELTLHPEGKKPSTVHLKQGYTLVSRTMKFYCHTQQVLWTKETLNCLATVVYYILCGQAEGIPVQRYTIPPISYHLFPPLRRFTNSGLVSLFVLSLTEQNIECPPIHDCSSLETLEFRWLTASAN